MSAAAETMAFLHAHGIHTEPAGLEEALRAAVGSIEARYRAEPGREGLTHAEVDVARAGGLEPVPTWGTVDPLLQGVVALASLIRTGLTTREAASRLGVTDARVRQRLADRTLLAIRTGHTWRLPLFQFVGAAELPGWEEVCRRLPPGASPVAIERWLSLPHPDLATGDDESPASPRAWLLAGRPSAVVAGLAGELA